MEGSFHLESWSLFLIMQLSRSASIVTIVIKILSYESIWILSRLADKALSIVLCHPQEELAVQRLVFRLVLQSCLDDSCS